MIHKLLILTGLGLLLAGVLYFSQLRPAPHKVSGFIEADEVRVGSRIGGRIARVLVREGDRVEVGQSLLEFDPFDLMQRRAEAVALVEQRNAVLARLKAGFREEEIAAAKSRVEQAQARLQRLEHGPRPQELEAARALTEQLRAELTLAEQTHARVKAVFERSAVTREVMEEANANLEASRARLRVREEELRLLEAGSREEDLAEARARLAELESLWQLETKGARAEERDEASAAVRAAEAALQVVDQQIAELRVVSPVLGTVEAIDLKPGDLVTANAPALSLLDLRQLWVRAYVPESQLDVQLGQELLITVDSYPKQQFHGKITYVAKQAEFTPSNVQTPEERSKQVFRIKVDLIDGLGQLRPGMSADVWLNPPGPPR